MVNIPFIEFPAFTEDVVLDGSPFRFSFNWNDRGEYWSIIIADTTDNILVAGLKLVLDGEIIKQLPGRNLPPGALIVVEPSDSITRIRREDFAEDVAQLAYATEDEMEIIEAGDDII